MCSLLVCRLEACSHSLLVAANRDEDPGRDTAPPGLHMLGETRAIFPRDRRHGGSWIGCNEHGLVVALTSWRAGLRDETAESRGRVVTTALEARSVDEASDGIEALCARGPIRSFQVVVADRRTSLWLRHRGADAALERRTLESAVTVLTESHGPDELVVPGLDPWAKEIESGDAEESDVEILLDRLVVVLAIGVAESSGGDETRQLCNAGREDSSFRTVSSTLLALPDDPEVADWRIRYAAESPRTKAPRDYSWLAQRLQA